MPLDADIAAAYRQRWRIEISGAVQGVGFRPTVYRHAAKNRVTGWVANTSAGVVIEAEGRAKDLHAFRHAIVTDPPPHAVIHQVTEHAIAPTGDTAFQVRDSQSTTPGDLLILPDLATCNDCLAEVFDPANRRHLYPFTNCTNCGPRYSIIMGLPYDRPATTMAEFEMCPACRAEYANPRDRRFHAQPNACPDCGPQMALSTDDGTVIADREAAVDTAIEQLRAGAILAVKGLGGFHLFVDATNPDAIARLRQRKRRPDKPLALMVPDLAWAKLLTHVDAVAEQSLTSAAAPIVLLPRKPNTDIADNVAPANPELGMMLPYTPLHHILLRGLGRPVIATSGNLSDEPIAIDNQDARARLADIADLFLLHNRPIVRPVEDSVVRILAGRPQILRRGRGYAPFPLPTGTAGQPVLATGPHLKNTTGILRGNQFFMSPHIGDLDTSAAEDLLRRTTNDLSDYTQTEPALVACDPHPDYASTRHAENLGLPTIQVQHHLAHVIACATEHNLNPPYLGIAWDGTGLGTDGTIWGGEFILVDGEVWHRVAHLHPFPLPGGDVAAREPRRAAFGLLYAAFGEAGLNVEALAPVTAFTAAERQTLLRAVEKGINAPLTSSMGRLFDGIAALLDIRQRATFEGQAAMELEWLARSGNAGAPYPFTITDDMIDWRPLLTAVLAAQQDGAAKADIAATFHATLADMMVAVARRTGVPDIILTGGCFQNRLLSELAIARLDDAGFKPHWHQQVPPNDGGIALGQAVWARLQRGKAPCA